MGTTENRAIIRRFYEAGNAGDLEAALAVLADDVTWTNIGSTPFSGTFTGKDVLLAELLGPVFSRLNGGIHATIDNVVAEGDFVVVQARGAAETIDGRPYNNTYCHVFQLRDDEIARVTEYFDTQLAERALGATADPAAESQWRS